jgi:predicted glycogen debranching enzyme
MKNLFNTEWLLTNGLGGYASGTISGANTRSYHGILVAAFTPPTDRKVMVAKVEERILNDGIYCDLSTNLYPSEVYPNGTNFLKDFVVTPFPQWIYGTAEWQLKKSILMVQGSNTTIINYSNIGNTVLNLEVHPLYACSDYHDVFREKQVNDFYSEFKPNLIKTYPYYGSNPIYTGWSDGEYFENRNWHRNIILPTEKERGLDYVCDYYHLGYVKVQLNPNEKLTLYFTVEESLLQEDIDNLLLKETEKQISSVKDSDFFQDLLQAGNQFIVHRESTKSMSVIAGYHWFADWGRDTMISMRGLTIAKGNKLASKSILNTFFQSIDRGMIPDRFPDRSKNSIPYNNIDATLWLFISLFEYYIQFQDLAFVKKHLYDLRNILDCHIHGTRYNIHVTKEGFLFGGEEDEQLTWMDAKVNGKIITPRIGCPVEVNALWYNALKIYAYFCKLLSIKFEKIYEDLITQFRINFKRNYMNPQGTLYDVIIPDVSSDDSFRPNQIYVLTLPFPLINKIQQKKIFKAIKEKLYTPYGLRTLDMDNPNFHRSYHGNQWQRDHAYHQGTVWPFLLYEYYCAFFNLYGTTLKNKKRVVKELAQLKDHFYHREGLHCISEIFDGIEPYEGKGCIHQAWSVGAVIKLYVDYKLYEIDLC